MAYPEGESWYSVGDLPENAVECQPAEQTGLGEAEEVSTLPRRVAQRTAFEDDRRFIVRVLVVTLCMATLITVAAVVFGRLTTEQALAVLAPLTTMVTAIVSFYFSRERK